MSVQLQVPSSVALDAEFEIAAEGVEEGQHVRIGISYENRAELYKAAVAQVGHEHFKPGDVSLTVRAEEAGTAHVTLWDWAQRVVLAEADVVVTDGR